MSRKKQKYAKTKHLKEAVEDMEVKDKLSLDARVEVYIGKGRVRYGIVKIKHFHVIPNVVLTLKKIDDNDAK